MKFTNADLAVLKARLDCSVGMQHSGLRELIQRLESSERSVVRYKKYLRPSNYVRALYVLWRRMKG